VGRAKLDIPISQKTQLCGCLCVCGLFVDKVSFLISGDYYFLSGFEIGMIFIPNTP